MSAKRPDTPAERVFGAAFCAVGTVVGVALLHRAQHEAFTTGETVISLLIGAAIGAVDFHHDFRKRNPQ